VTAIAAGLYHTLALKDDHTVWAWGENGEGAVGNGSPEMTQVPSPALVLSGVSAISAGWRLSMAVKMDGTVWGWGARDSGQLGDGVSSDDGALTPTSSATSVRRAGSPRALTTSSR
jgi:alpha-tubulin suppressor-like RCC1 family protein